MKATCSKLNCSKSDCTFCTAYYKKTEVKLIASYKIDFETMEIEKIPLDPW